MKVRLKISGVDITLSTSIDKSLSAWSARYKNSLVINKIPSNVESRGNLMGELKLPIDDGLRKLFWDKRYKYFKLKMYSASSVQMHSVLKWEAMAYITINPRLQLTRYNNSNFVNDYGTWSMVIAALCRSQLKEQLKTNTTII